MAIEITTKSNLYKPAPYTIHTVEECLGLHRSRRDIIDTGTFGTYLAREIKIDGDKWFFLFLDVDGSSEGSDDDKIRSAIINVQLILLVLKNLGVDQEFMVYTTGNTGFRIFSNLLLDYDSYKAFIEFARIDLRLIDMKPTEDLDLPHQLFAYKGNPQHNPNELVHRHSVRVSWDRFENGDMTPDYYKEISDGYPDADIVIEDLERCLDFRPIYDLTTLGSFGQRLGEIKQISSNKKFKPFNTHQKSQQRSTLSIDALSVLLNESEIPHHLIDDHGVHKINFNGVPCPACGDPTHNAWVFGDQHYLACYGTNCPAHLRSGGLPLSEWFYKSGQPNISQRMTTTKLEIISTNEVTIQEARDRIIEGLESNEDVLLRVSPGAGKSHTVIERLIKYIDTKIIIYSCNNVALQKEVSKKAKDLAPGAANIYMWKPRAEHCSKKETITEITESGYSPAELECNGCKDRETCGYYLERVDPGPGLYIVTHRMLQYMENKITPDRIILDENIIDGFRVVEKVKEGDLRTIMHWRHLEVSGQLIIGQLLTIVGDMLNSVSLRKEFPYGCLFNAKEMKTQQTNEDTILRLIADGMQKSEKDITADINAMINKITSHDRTKLYKDKINYKAVNWLKGLVSDEVTSYVMIDSKPNTPASFETKQITKLPFNDVPITVLDGTGEQKVISFLLGQEIREIRADVTLNAKLVHFQKSIDRRSARKYKNDDKEIEKFLIPCLAETSSPKVLILTYKFFAEQVKKVCQKLAPGKQFSIHHYHGPRGENKFEDIDAVLVIGMPIANLASVSHDAHMFFSEDNQEGLRNIWSVIAMENELEQGIHRIRPILKANAEIVVVSSRWPSCLPEPVIINQPRQGNVTDIAIQMLEPWVREFGFLNPDIVSMAGIILTKKGKETNDRTDFRRNMKTLIETFIRFQCYIGRGQQVSGNLISDISNNTVFEENGIKNLFGVMVGIYLLYTKINTKQIFFKKVRKIIKKQGYIINQQIKISAENVWPDLKKHLTVKFPAMEEFEIKLPHAQNKPIMGIGYKTDVLDFYDNLNSFGMFGKKKVDLTSYTSKSTPQVILAPITSGHLVIYFDDSDLIQVGYGATVKSFSKSSPSDLVTLLIRTIDPVITNDGKELAKIIIRSGHGDFCTDDVIHDVILRDVVITNGLGSSSNLSPTKLFEKHGFSSKVDNRLLLSQMFDVWDWQDEIIERDGLEVTVQQRSQALWLVAGLGLNGPFVDVEGLLNFWDQLPAGNSSIRKHATTLLNAVSIDDRYMSTIKNHMSLTGRITYGFQQTNKEHLRRFIVAASGFKLISADYSQLEPRILAYRANDQNAIAIFKSGKDIYEIFAIMIEQQLQRALGQDSRNIAKGIIVGCNNGKSVYGVQKELQEYRIFLDLDEIRLIIDLYYAKFPGIASYQVREVANAISRVYAVSPLGMRRYLQDGESGKPENKIKIFLTQGTASEGFIIAINKIRHEIQSQNLKAHIVGIIHDEVLVEADECVAERVLGIVTNSMESAYEGIFPNLPFPVTAGIIKYWGDKNPVMSIPLVTLTQCYDCQEHVEDNERWDYDLCRCGDHLIPIFGGMPKPDMCNMM